MTLRQLWAELRIELYEFQTITRDSQLYRHLSASGVSSERLDAYIRNGCGRKARGCVIPSADETSSQVEKLLDAGGSIAGGSAVRKWLFVDGARDYDVFFPDIVSFVNGHLSVFDNPIIDVCLYRETPYELCDLTASECAYSKAGFLTSRDFDIAMETGVADIKLSAIVDPKSTLRRVAKYGELYGLKFPREKILVLATTGNMDREIAQRALDYAT